MSGHVYECQDNCFYIRFVRMDKYWVNTKQDEDKQTKNTTQKIENMSNTDPTKTRG